jgi:hypothetical protein
VSKDGIGQHGDTGEEEKKTSGTDHEERGTSRRCEHVSARPDGVGTRGRREWQE